VVARGRDVRAARRRRGAPPVSAGQRQRRSDALRAARALGFTWIRSDFPEYPTQVDVSITDLGEGRSRVELVHSGWDALPGDYVEQWKPIHDAGWAHFLRLLGDLVAGRPVDKTWGAE
jgi:hypothetical protein